MADVQQTYKFGFEFDRKDIKKQLNGIAGDVQETIARMGDASDKVVIFKDLVKYLSNVDKALDVFKSKHKNDFDDIFGSPDASILAVLEDIFGATEKSAQAFVDLKKRMAEAATGKSDLRVWKGIAKDINALYASVGKEMPIDIDGMKSAKGVVKMLGDTLDQFGEIYAGFQDKLKGGFGGGAGGFGVGDIAEKIRKEIKNLESSLVEYKNVQKELQKISNAHDVFEKDEWLDENISIEYTIDNVKLLAEEYNKAKKAKTSFEEKGDISSIEYYKALAKYAKIVLQAKDVNANFINGDKKTIAKLKEIKFGEASLYHAMLDIDDPDVDEVFNNLTSRIDEVINKTEIKITEMVNKLQSVGTGIGTAMSDATKDADKAGNAVDEFNKKIKDTETYVKALSGHLKEMFSVASRRANFEYHIAIDGLDIKAGHGLEKQVDLATQTGTYLDTLFAESAIYGHSHQGGDADTNISDIEAVLTHYKNGVSIPLHFVVGNDAITTIDFTGVSKDIIDQLMQEIASTNSNKQAPVDYDKINKIVERLTGKSNALQSWGANQIDDLAKYLYDVSSAATSALTPMEKFQAILDNMFGKGKVNASKYESLLSSLNKDNAKNLFNQIASKEGLQPIDTKDMLTMGQANAEIDESIARYKTLREEANKSYADIRSEVDKVITHFKSGGGTSSGLDFFQQYFPEGEWQVIRGLLTDAYDNLISIEEVTNRIANEFGVNPDDFAKIPTGQGTGSGQPIDDDELDIIVKENGALEDKLELLQEIADQYGVNIDQRKRNSYEKLVDKDNEEGLTERDADRFAELSETIDEADSNLMEFEEHYERIVLKLSNGKKLEILPNDKGLRDLYHISDNYGTYQGHEIEDVQFIRHQQVGQAAEVGQAIEEANKKLDTFLALSKEISNNSFYQMGDATDNVEIGKYIERLTVAKNELEELGKQGLLTAEQIGYANDAFNVASEHLRDSTKTYDDYYSSHGYDYSYYSEYREQRDRADAAEAEVERLSEELSKRTLETPNGQRKLFEDIEDDSVRADNAVSELNDELRETRELDGQISIDDYMVAKDAETAQKVKDESKAVSQEAETLEELRKKLVEVREAVEAKTGAFETEQTTVGTVVDTEIIYLNNLIDRLIEIVTQIGLIESGFNRINSNVPNVDLNVPKNADNTHYVTDPQGNPVTAYRGIHGSYGGMVSNRYHGGTFWTTNIELAKEYAGEIGKVEKSMLSMMNPMEISGNGALWNQIEYIGDNSDETSQKLFELNASIRFAKKLLADAEKIPISDGEKKAIRIGGMLEDSTKRAREISYWTQELEKFEKEKADILADTSNPYGIKNTNEIVEIAKAKGYDGVIFKDIIDSATGSVRDISTVMVTFEQDQIHYLETITSTFETAVATLKNRFGDLIQHISASGEDVESTIRKMAELKGKIQTGEISEDEYNAFVSGNALARDYEKLARKAYAHPDFITGALNGDEFDIKHVTKRINEYIEDMRKRLQSTAKAFGKEGLSVDELLAPSAGVDSADTVDTEVAQLDKLQAALVEVKNAVLAKTKAFYDEGTVVGQVVGKEISALTKLLEIVDKIAPKVEAMAANIAAIGPIDLVQQTVETGTDTTASNISPKDKFKSRVSHKKGAMTTYIEELKGVQYVADVTRQELIDLRDAMDSVKTPAGLNAIVAKFEELQKEIGLAKKNFEDINLNKVNKEKSKLFGVYNGLTRDQQKDLEPELEQAISQLNRYEADIKEGKKIELDAIEAVTHALRQKLETYQQVNKEAKKQTSGIKADNSNFGETISINAAAKYNRLSKIATDQFTDSREVSAVLAEYTKYYEKMNNLRDTLRSKNKNDITSEDRESFKSARDECNEYAKALEKLINNSLKLHGEKANKEDYMLGADFNYSDIDMRKASLADFAKEMYGVNIAATDFKDNWSKVVFAVDNGDGTFTQMTATFTDARNEIVAMAGDTKEVQSALSSFISGFKGRVKSLAQYFLATISIYDAIRVLRQGVTYVKEIDSALTELKKVTDETDATYRRFLQTASQTGAKIGSTVADLVNATADFARLGYNIEEAASLAEAASVYKNVGDGIDDITTASESIISTMKAFGIEADNAMGIVDRFNEIGNNFAISSTGIGEAMQRSASALFEAGNTIDESIALITGANSVVQNPEQVGELIAHQHSNMLLVNSYIG